jgi:TetR/AcrR family transcriptional regulator
MIENIHRAEHLAESESIANLNMPAIAITGRILERGRAEGVFRRPADAIDVHMLISSFCIFRVANRHTFGALFGRDLMSDDLRDHYRAMLGDLVVDYLRAGDG